MFCIRMPNKICESLRADICNIVHQFIEQDGRVPQEAVQTLRGFARLDAGFHQLDRLNSEFGQYYSGQQDDYFQIPYRSGEQQAE